MTVTANPPIVTLYAELLELSTSSEDGRVWLYKLLLARNVKMFNVGAAEYGYLPMGPLFNAFDYIEALLANLAANPSSPLYVEQTLKHKELDRSLDVQQIGDVFVMTLRVASGDFSATFLFSPAPS